MSIPAADFYRLDPLTGGYNFLSFVETLAHMAAQEEKQQFSILYADLNDLGLLNETKGHIFGDSVIHWLGIVLQEECNSTIYRTGGDDFAVILTDGLQADYEELLNRIFARANKEGKQLDLPYPPAKIGLIHFDTCNDISINDVMFHLGEAIYDLKTSESRTIKIFLADDMLKSTAKGDEQDPSTIQRSWEALRSIANQSINRLLLMGRGLDVAQKNSYLDAISGLPNLRAAMVRLEKEIASQQPFAILLIDGDNLRIYNTISYAAGDELIRKMGRLLSENLRPGDFIARWRTGDELIVILPGVSGAGARIAGERFCAAIREAANDWHFPTSITIGVAIYPQDGEQVDVLIDAAETANKRGKEQGKDRVVLAG
jgi:diguanylate cyclase (GGDEF)-like protein